MIHQAIPDYLVIAVLLGFGTGTVLSVLLALLVYRTAHRSPGTRLLVVCGLLWNVFGLVMELLVVSGVDARSVPVMLMRATFLSAGAIFPVAFLQLWSQPEELRRCGIRCWLLRASVFNAFWLIGLLFACSFLRNPVFTRLTSHVVPWNASLLLTLGAFLLVRGRLAAAADRIHLILTMIGAWGSTIAIFILDYVRLSPREMAFVAIAREQSPFLAVLGALFFFANFRASDVLIKHSLRIVGAVSIGLWSWFFVSRKLPALTSGLGAAPFGVEAALGSALIAALLLFFWLADRAMVRIVDSWILNRPDCGAALQRLWDRMVAADAGPELFAAAAETIREALDVRAVRVLRRAEVPAIETYCAANAGQWWELSSCDACRGIVPGLDIDVLVPVRVHGEITHVLAVAPGASRHSLLNPDLVFLQTAAGQIGSRLEALAHEREKIERQSREAKLREMAAQAELKALRAQVNPHFLFNSLNTIADLIVTDPPKAEAMTVLLAKVFRHVLAHSDRQLTRVAEEMDFLRTYLGIEQVRFGARLQVSMNLDPAVSEERIPSLILQPVVENAIKHGLAPKIGEGHLSITAAPQNGFVRLAVEDDGVGAPAAENGSAHKQNNGVGLKIIAERLKTLYSGRASLNIEWPEAGSRVTILIPRSETPV